MRRSGPSQFGAGCAGDRRVRMRKRQIARRQPRTSNHGQHSNDRRRQAQTITAGSKVDSLTTGSWRALQTSSPAPPSGLRLHSRAGNSDRRVSDASAGANRKRAALTHFRPRTCNIETSTRAQRLNKIGARTRAADPELRARGTAKRNAKQQTSNSQTRGNSQVHVIAVQRVTREQHVHVLEAVDPAQIERRSVRKKFGMNASMRK
jgi:hypothetical protein